MSLLKCVCVKFFLCQALTWFLNTLKAALRVRTSFQVVFLFRIAFLRLHLLGFFLQRLMKRCEKEP